MNDAQVFTHTAKLQSMHEKSDGRSGCVLVNSKDQVVAAGYSTQSFDAIENALRNLGATNMGKLLGGTCYCVESPTMDELERLTMTPCRKIVFSNESNWENPDTMFTLREKWEGSGGEWEIVEIR